MESLHVRATKPFRITARDGREFHNTKLVRLKFQGKTRPKKMFYGKEVLDIYPYYQKLIICAKCSITGHLAKNCRSEPRCGICSRAHSKRNCNLKERAQTNRSLRKCPNCRKQHNAGYGGCIYIRIEKEILRLHAELQWNRNNTRKLLWEEYNNTGDITSYNKHTTNNTQEHNTNTVLSATGARSRDQYGRNKTNHAKNPNITSQHQDRQAPTRRPHRTQAQLHTTHQQQYYPIHLHQHTHQP